MTLSVNQHASGIRLSMAPTSSIAGRITDRDGDPVPDARVNLLRKAYQNGKTVLENAQVATTDDHGEYRLYSLPPGAYYLTARPFEGRSSQWPAESEPTIVPNRAAVLQLAGAPLVTRRLTDEGPIVEETWSPVFYPSVIDARSAEVLHVHMGENLRGMDISLAASATAARHVRGTVIDGATGMPAAGATVRLIPRDPLTPTIVMPSGDTDERGRFDIQGVLPTQYFLLVSGAVSAYMPLDVGGSEVENLKIAGSKGVDIPWRASIDGSTDDRAAVRQLRITLLREPGIAGAPSGAVVTTMGWPGIPAWSVTPRNQTLPTGGFLLPGVPLGDYRINVAGLPPGSYVESIRSGNTDLLLEKLRIAGSLENPVEIVLGTDTGTLSGAVHNDRREPTPNVTIVLVPNGQQRSRIDLYKNVATDSSGRFRFEGVAPGEYKLFAWEDVVNGAWHDPDFMAGQEVFGTPARAAQGASETFDIEVIPWRAQ
jgi:5-hydroxyisourate hydrolase-like protein (transthyretin family)